MTKRRLGTWVSSAAVRILAAIILAWLMVLMAAAWALREPGTEVLAGYPDAERLSLSRPAGGFAPLDQSFIRRRLGTARPTGQRARPTDSSADAPPARPQGVTAKEITVVAYFDQAAYDSEPSPNGGTYVDVDAPELPKCPQTYPSRPSFAVDPKKCDHALVRVLKAYSKFFNDPDKTYGRRIHYWAYFAAGDATPDRRRGDAIEIWQRLHPFAVINGALFGGFNDVFDEQMAELGVVTFDSFSTPKSNAWYRALAPYTWSFWPDLEHRARLYSSYICQRIAPLPVRHYGGAARRRTAPNGQRRVFGLWYPTDGDALELADFADLVRGQLDACGVELAAVATYTHEGSVVNTSDTTAEGARAAIRFQSAGVTTVLAIGTETRFGTAADAIQYYPEIVLAGDLNNDNNATAQYQNVNAWRNAWAVTFNVRVAAFEDSPGYRAYRAGASDVDDRAAFFTRILYPDNFLLFAAIARAGKSLTAATLSRGMHAIEKRSSTSPFEPATYFDTDDYSAVKDGAELWWDPDGRSPSGRSTKPGCWRMTHAGRRTLADRWKAADDVFRSLSDPCTGYDGVTHLG